METDEGAGAVPAEPARDEAVGAEKAPSTRRSRCWGWVRVVLALLEIAAAARGQVAIATAVKAATIVGDAVFARPGH